MDLARVMACIACGEAARRAGQARCYQKQLAQESNHCDGKLAALRREASIWNMITRLAKVTGTQDYLCHAPELFQEEYKAMAWKRWRQLTAWVEHHPEQAKAACADRIAEYAKREEQRNQHTVMVG